MRVSIVTGATGAMGREITKALVSEGKTVVMACRNRSKASEVASDIVKECPNGTISIMQLDLADRNSINSFIAEANKQNLEIENLVCNAGILEKEQRYNGEKLDLDASVNYLGNVRLIEGLRSRLASDAVVVNVISLTIKYGNLSNDIFHPTTSFNRFRRYADSKLALFAYTENLAKQYDGTDVKVYAADPGVVDSDMISQGAWYDVLADIFFRPFIRSPKKGAETAIYLCREKPHATGMAYYDCKIKKLSSDLYEQGEFINLWNATQPYL